MASAPKQVNGTRIQIHRHAPTFLGLGHQVGPDPIELCSVVGPFLPQDLLGVGAARLVPDSPVTSPTFCCIAVSTGPGTRTALRAGDVPVEAIRRLGVMGAMMGWIGAMVVGRRRLESQKRFRREGGRWESIDSGWQQSRCTKAKLCLLESQWFVRPRSVVGAVVDERLVPVLMAKDKVLVAP